MNGLCIFFLGNRCNMPSVIWPWVWSQQGKHRCKHNAWWFVTLRPFSLVAKEKYTQAIHKIKPILILWMSSCVFFLSNQRKNARCDSSLKRARCGQGFSALKAPLRVETSPGLLTRSEKLWGGNATRDAFSLCDFQVQEAALKCHCRPRSVDRQA